MGYTQTHVFLLCDWLYLFVKVPRRLVFSYLGGGAVSRHLLDATRLLELVVKKLRPDPSLSGLPLTHASHRRLFPSQFLDIAKLLVTTKGYHWKCGKIDVNRVDNIRLLVPNLEYLARLKSKNRVCVETMLQFLLAEESREDSVCFEMAKILFASDGSNFKEKLDVNIPDSKLMDL